jgi:alginate O-acetyltransferase complex protein AlgI
MLFNSLEFIFLFLPTTLLGFFLLGRWRRDFAAAWLAIASLVFYAWWSPIYVGLLLASIACNYFLGLRIGHSALHKRAWLSLALTINLLALCYFKYANFFVENVETLFGFDWQIANVILPLGISFFTFTQIAFLADTYQGKAKEYNLIHYVLFVTYFPHLIAGPVLHHKQMMPQFGLPETYQISSASLSIGLTIFAIGLFKKVVLADGIAVYVAPVFSAAEHGKILTIAEAWGGALSYTFQLYFDFSGYSDMAIGLSRLFNIKLPLNFNSPYKAANIIDFWRRWHMTLSHFLRDYLYIALGGNRHGVIRRYINLALTMLLGGLWHGAGWTFVIWGGLHGIYLVINHLWRGLWQNKHGDVATNRLGRFSGVGLTFVAVVVGWVFFRSANFSTGLSIVKSMFGGNGVILPMELTGMLGSEWQSDLAAWGISSGEIGALFKRPMQAYWIIGSLAFVWLLPNTQEILRDFEPALADRSERTALPKWWAILTWKPRRYWALATAITLAWGILGISRVSEFLYFQF